MRITMTMYSGADRHEGTHRVPRRRRLVEPVASPAQGHRYRRSGVNTIEAIVAKNVTVALAAVRAGTTT